MDQLQRLQLSERFQSSLFFLCQIFLLPNPGNRVFPQVLFDRLLILSMIDQNELANRYFWILEYITVDNLDPVSTVQTQLRKGSYRKKHGSRYDSHNEDLGLFAMLTPPISDPEPAVFYSPSTVVRTEALSPAEPSMESDSWRSNSNRTRFSPTKLAADGVNEVV